MGSYFVQIINTIHTKVDVMVAGLPDACCDSDKLPETKLESFTLLNTKEVRKFIEGSTKKTCTLDPVPTSIMTSCIDVLLPVITKIVNLSLESGIFAGDWKCALVNPLLKKDNFDLLFKKIRQWLIQYRLMINDDKTEFLLI